jgi:anti-anti-sigma factor
MLRITTDIQAQQVVLKLTGELGPLALDPFRRKLEDLLQLGHRTIILDLQQLQFLYSDALAAIAQTALVLRRAGGRLYLANPSERLNKLFRIAGLWKLLQPIAPAASNRPSNPSPFRPTASPPPSANCSA